MIIYVHLLEFWLVDGVNGRSVSAAGEFSKAHQVGRWQGRLIIERAERSFQLKITMVGQR